MLRSNIFSLRSLARGASRVTPGRRAYFPNNLSARLHSNAPEDASYRERRARGHEDANDHCRRSSNQVTFRSVKRDSTQEAAPAQDAEKTEFMNSYHVLSDPNKQALEYDSRLDSLVETGCNNRAQGGGFEKDVMERLAEIHDLTQGRDGGIQVLENKTQSIDQKVSDVRDRLDTINWKSNETFDIYQSIQKNAQEANQGVNAARREMGEYYQKLDEKAAGRALDLAEQIQAVQTQAMHNGMKIVDANESLELVTAKVKSIENIVSNAYQEVELNETQLAKTFQKTIEATKSDVMSEVSRIMKEQLSENTSLYWPGGEQLVADLNSKLGEAAKHLGEDLSSAADFRSFTDELGQHLSEAVQDVMMRQDADARRHIERQLADAIQQAIEATRSDTLVEMARLLDAKLEGNAVLHGTEAEKVLNSLKEESAKAVEKYQNVAKTDIALDEPDQAALPIDEFEARVSRRLDALLQARGIDSNTLADKMLEKIKGGLRYGNWRQWYASWDPKESQANPEKVMNYLEGEVKNSLVELKKEIGGIAEYLQNDVNDALSELKEEVGEIKENIEEVQELIEEKFEDGNEDEEEECDEENEDNEDEEGSDEYSNGEDKLPRHEEISGQISDLKDVFRKEFSELRQNLNAKTPVGKISNVESFATRMNILEQSSCDANKKLDAMESRELSRDQQANNVKEEWEKMLKANSIDPENAPEEIWKEDCATHKHIRQIKRRQFWGQIGGTIAFLALFCNNI